MMYEMQRTNIYLDTRQLAALRGAAQTRGAPVAELVREAVDQWLERNGVQVVEADEWSRGVGPPRSPAPRRRRGCADRDPDDAPVVASALAGGVEAIVRGDAHLLDDPCLKAWLGRRDIEVISPAELLERLRDLSA
jgi:Ribbon-helix-helix protein, copG family